MALEDLSDLCCPHCHQSQQRWALKLGEAPSRYCTFEDFLRFPCLCIPFANGFAKRLRINFASDQASSFTSGRKERAFGSASRKTSEKLPSSDHVEPPGSLAEGSGEAQLNDILVRFESFDSIIIRIGAFVCNRLS